MVSPSGATRYDTGEARNGTVVAEIAFEELVVAHRHELLLHCYRLLGSLTDAEDVLQEAYLRWRRQDEQTIRRPRAYLTTLVTRLCID
jgi:RNA polymerase sigma-70 factor (ECF subfamily)